MMSAANTHTTLAAVASANNNLSQPKLLSAAALSYTQNPPIQPSQKPLYQMKPLPHRCIITSQLHSTQARHAMHYTPSFYKSATLGGRELLFSSSQLSISTRTSHGAIHTCHLSRTCHTLVTQSGLKPIHSHLSPPPWRRILAAGLLHLR